MSVIGTSLVGIINREEWQSRGACRGHERPDSWFPEKKSPAEQTLEARAVCVGCEVRGECLQYAMDHPEEPGIWGGLTKSERDGLRSGRDVKAFASCVECSKDFVKSHGWHRYCSEGCRKTSERRRDRAYATRQRERMRDRRAKASGAA